MAGRLDERRSDWVGIVMMQHMFFVGSCFRRDLTNLARMYASAPKVSRAYTELLNMGLIKIKIRFGRECVDITDKAKAQIADTGDWFEQNQGLFKSVSRLTSEKTFQSLYGRSKALPPEKPDFYQFYQTMSGEDQLELDLEEDLILDDDFEDEPFEPEVYPVMDEDEISELLSTRGIFYGIREITNAFGKIYPGNPDR